MVLKSIFHRLKSGKCRFTSQDGEAVCAGNKVCFPLPAIVHLYYFITHAVLLPEIVDPHFEGEPLLVLDHVHVHRRVQQDGIRVSKSQFRFYYKQRY